MPMHIIGCIIIVAGVLAEKIMKFKCPVRFEYCNQVSPELIRCQPMSLGLTQKWF